MAEAVGLVSSIAVLFTFTRDLLHFLNKIQQNSAGFTAVQARLIAEEKKLQLWMTYLNVQEWADLENVLDPRDLEQLKGLWDRLFELVEEAQRRLHRLDISIGSKASPVKNLNKVRVVMTGEFEKLTNVLDAIEAINSLLYVFATPPPGYIPPRIENRNRSVNQDRVRPSRSPITCARDDNSSTSRSEHETPPTPAPRQENPIAVLFYQAVSTLKIISQEKTVHPGIISCLSKLRGWPGTFLEGEIALDRLLAKKENGVVVNKMAKQTLMTIFVDILLIERTVVLSSIKLESILTQVQKPYYRTCRRSPRIAISSKQSWKSGPHFSKTKLLTLPSKGTGPHYLKALRIPNS